MKLAMSLTLEGLVRALRTRVHDAAGRRADAKTREKPLMRPKRGKPVREAANASRQ